MVFALTALLASLASVVTVMVATTGPKETVPSVVFTSTMEPFYQPNCTLSVNVSITTTSALFLSQVVYIDTAGYYLVTRVVDSMHVQVANLCFEGNAPSGMQLARMARLVIPQALEDDRRYPKNQTIFIPGTSFTATPSQIVLGSFVPNGFQSFISFNLPSAASLDAFFVIKYVGQSFDFIIANSFPFGVDIFTNSPGGWTFYLQGFTGVTVNNYLFRCIRTGTNAWSIFWIRGSN
jgi:hypothetical protein